MKKVTIIELAGLAGAGKTTRAENLARERGVPIIHAPERMPSLIIDGFAGALMRPRSAFSLLLLIWKEPNRKIRRSLFINGWLGASAKYWRARMGGIIDQGYLQALIGTLPRVSDSKLIARVLAGVPRDFEIIWCEADYATRTERLFERSQRPREEFGELEANRFADENERAYHLVRDIFGNRLRTRVNGSRFRRAVKLVVYVFAWMLRTFTRPFNRTSEAVVLMYHAIDNSDWKLSVTPEKFERQMAYLAERGWIVPLTDIVAYARGGKKLPRHAVAITFDDGYRDLLTTALPILEQYHIPATIFVPTDLSTATSPQSRERLSWDELRTLEKSGLVTIGSHARTHKKLSMLSEDEVRRELTGSANDIEREIGKRPHFFAYPFGDRSPATEDIAREMYDASFAISEGTIHPGDTLTCLKRVQIDGTVSFFLFRMRLTAALDWNRRMIDTVRAMMSI